MPKTGAGPSKGAINLDSYQNDAMPVIPASNLVKRINPADAKVGPPKPSFLGGKSLHAFADNYYE